MIEKRYIDRIAKDLGLTGEQVAEAVKLLDKGNTVPFIAQYRRDITGDVDARRLMKIAERNQRYIALGNRRGAVLENIEKQDRLTPELRTEIEAADTPERLEDLYLCFKKQRHPRANTAKAQGLEPLAEFIWLQIPGNKPLVVLLEEFMNPSKSVSSPEEALEGALAIIAERVTLDAAARKMIRDAIKHDGVVHTAKTKLAESATENIKEFHDFRAPLKNISGPKLLAIYRAFRKGFLRLEIELDHAALCDKLLKHFVKEGGSQFEAPMREAINAAYKTALHPALEEEVVSEARAKAEDGILTLLQQNARAILMAVAAKGCITLGVESGGGKKWHLAVIGKDGAFLEAVRVNLEESDAAKAAILALIQKHGVQGIAVGNASNSREVVPYLHELVREMQGRRPFVAYVNESGIQRYAASDLAAKELPEIENGARNAASIARRLQDPLKELIKMELRSIGLGSHVQDIPPRHLQESLAAVATECVSVTGVDINTASEEELRYVSGIQMGTAQNIVAYRKEHGPFKKLEDLKAVAGIGDKTYDQCVGILMIPDAENFLERTKIHPEFYPVVEKMAEKLGCAVADIFGSREKLDQINLEEYISESVGLIALEDIRQEIFHPGTDPRRPFALSRTFGVVSKLEEVKEGMVLEGMITNVTDFGAFVDIGVEQDGLIHKSELISHYVSDPRGILRVGDLLKVEVIKVDLERKQVSLSKKAALRKPLTLPERPPAPPRPPRQQRPQEGGAAQGAGQDRPQRPQQQQDRQGQPGGDRRPPRRDEKEQRIMRPSEMGGAAARQQRPRDNQQNDRPPRREGGKRPERGPRSDGKSVVLVNKSGKDENLNTPFADQLALLKAQLEAR